ncbi:MAG: ABC transporter ATP-binding protein [Nitrospirae bacterium]|nr:MAG: ABC transporter ATP-binding protein [Nitrospirota bacterium]
MSDIAIRVENLSKQYEIGAARHREDILRDQLVHGFKKLCGRGPKAQATKEIFHALTDVSFEVRQGEVIGIIGRNGAGKSTLLKILSRITKPTQGRAEIYGRVGSLLEVGTGFHQELTGGENIFLNGAILGMKKNEIRRKFDEIVAFAEVEQFINTPVKHYSSGMYVRLAFAVAAHLEPEILIVDEVLAVGDVGFQKKCIGKMGDVAKNGRTVLFVSHNMAAVSQLCEHAVWLEHGQVKEIGNAAELVKDYLSDENSQKAACMWPHVEQAPGDDRVRLMAGRIVQDGRVTSVVDINEPARIEIEFEVLRPVRNLVCGIDLFNSMELCLFSNCDWRPNFLTPGRYRKHVDVPPQLLAEGRVSVMLQLFFYSPTISSVALRDALIFDATDSDHPLSVRGPQKGAWPGVVRVRLEWGEASPVQKRRPSAVT